MPGGFALGKRNYYQSSVYRSIMIVKLLSKKNLLTASQIARELNIPRTTCFNLLQTLLIERLLNKDNDNKHTINKDWFHAILNVNEHDSLRKIAQPVLEELTTKTGMTSHLAVREGKDTIYLEKVDALGYVKFNTYVGQTLPLYTTGVGKAFLMSINNDDIFSLYKDYEFVKVQENTVSNVEDLITQVEKARKNGYAIEDEEGEIGIRCIGAPIINSEGKTVASLSITTLKERLPIQDYTVIGKTVIEAARQVAVRLEENIN